MGSVTRFELAWELHLAGLDPAEIGSRVSRDRATVYRWLAGIRQHGIRELVRRKQAAYQRRQPRKVVGEVARLVKQIRRKRGWCGQKIRKELLGWGTYQQHELEEVQAKVDEYVHHFIYERWHMGLPDMMTPAQFKDWYAEQEQRKPVVVAFAP